MPFFVSESHVFYPDFMTQPPKLHFDEEQSALASFNRSAGMSAFPEGDEVVCLRVEQGKGHKDRFAPIGARALHWIEKYLTETRPRLLPAC